MFFLLYKETANIVSASIHSFGAHSLAVCLRRTCFVQTYQLIGKLNYIIIMFYNLRTIHDFNTMRKLKLDYDFQA